MGRPYSHQSPLLPLQKQRLQVSVKFKMGRPYSHQSPPLPLHLCFFLLILFLFMGLSWYLNYESVLEDLMDQMKLVFMISPLILLLALHWLSTDETRRVLFLVPLPERESFHRAGSSPWGVGVVLVLLMFMISYQSYFHVRWFPLLSR